MLCRNAIRRSDQIVQSTGDLFELHPGVALERSDRGINELARTVRRRAAVVDGTLDAREQRMEMRRAMAPGQAGGGLSGRFEAGEDVLTFVHSIDPRVPPRPAKTGCYR